tara:strand:+ start:2020 stop:2220 length:201 start_codon:yes stop_codon:yes gene_type:complete
MAVEHQLITVITCRKGVFIPFGFVFVHAVFDFGGDTGVEDFVVGVRCYVGAGVFHEGKVKENFAFH